LAESCGEFVKTRSSNKKMPGIRPGTSSTGRFQSTACLLPFSSTYLVPGTSTGKISDLQTRYATGA